MEIDEKLLEHAKRVEEFEAENERLKEKIQRVIDWSSSNELAPHLADKWGKRYIDACKYARQLLED